MQLKRHAKKLFSILGFSCLLIPAVSFAFTNTFYVINNNDSGTGSLRDAMTVSNNSPGNNRIIINPGIGSINIASSLPVLTNSVSIISKSSTPQVINGESSFQSFFVYSGNVDIQNITVRNGEALGGTGGSNGAGGGGGGLGAGGALFVRKGTHVTAQSVNFTSNTAEGGTGGNSSSYNLTTSTAGGGGGGLSGAGGNVVTTTSLIPGCGGGGGGLRGMGGTGEGGGGGGGGFQGNGGSVEVSLSGGYGGGGGGGLFGNGGNVKLGGGGGGGGTTTSDNGGTATGNDGAGGGGPSGGSGGIHNFTGNGGNGGNGGFDSGGGGGGDGYINGGSGGKGGKDGGGGGGGVGASVGGSGGSGGQGGGGGGGGSSGSVNTNTGNGGNGGNGGISGGGGGGGSGISTDVNGMAGNGGRGGEGAGGGGGGTIPNTSISGHGGQGGFGGGGGGSQNGNGGIGGFGAGGGGSAYETPGVSMFGGGTGGSDHTLISGAGGGGAGLGGAIFIQNGGYLFLKDCKFSNNQVVVGIGGTGGSTAADGKDGIASGKDIFLMSGGSITFDETIGTSLNLINPIKGNQLVGGGGTGGGLTKVGAGKLTLNGANTYTGLTTVSQGTLSVNGSIITPVDVLRGGTLRGTGRIFGKVTNHGTVEPGNDNTIGTLTVNSATFASGSTFKVELNPNRSDLLIAAVGGVTIQNNVTLAVQVDPGNYSARSRTKTPYTIISSAGLVTGVFSRLTSTNPSLHLFAVYFPHQVELFVLTKLFQGIKLTGNAAAVAHCLNKAHPAPFSDLYNILFFLEFETRPRDLQNDLEELQPSELKGLAVTQENANIRVRSGITTHLWNLRHTCSSEVPSSVWVDTFGDLSRQNRTGQEVGYNARIWGGLGGVDYQLFDGITFGLGGAYTTSHLKWKESRGDSNMHNYYGFIYGSWVNDWFYLNSTYTGVHNRFNVHRGIEFLNRTARSHFDGTQFASNLTLGTACECGKFDLEPFVSVDYIYSHQNKIKENGARSVDLKVKKSHYEYLRSEAGFMLSQVYRCDTFTWISSAQLSVIRESRLTGQDYHARLTGTNCEFTVKGHYPSQTLFSPAYSITLLNRCNCMSLTFNYEGEFASKWWEQEVNLQFNYSF